MKRDGFSMVLAAFAAFATFAAGCGGGGGGGGGSTVGGGGFVGTPVGIVTVALPEGVAGLAYSATVRAENGANTSYTWSVIQGTLPPGLTLAGGVPTASLAGAPTVAGTFSILIQVEDAKGGTDVQAYTIEVKPGLAIATATLPAAVLNVGYNQPIAAAGASNQGFQWTVVSGLPPGLSLAASGTPSTALTGTPTAVGTFNLTVRVTDVLGSTNQRVIPVTVNPTLSITTTTLPDGHEAFPYTSSITATGGSATNYVWSLQTGSLPPGVVFSPRSTPTTPVTTTTSIGTLAGTANPTVFNFTVQVTDSAGANAQRAFAMNVFHRLEVLPPLTLPIAVSGTAYTASLTGFGGTGAGYNWRVFSGTFPAGLTLSATGTPAAAITGTPTTPGTYNFVVEITDSAAEVNTAAITLTVSPPIDILTTTLPGGFVGVPYGARILADFGTEAGYQWALDAGSLPLPDGVVLTAAKTPTVRLGGIPTTAGTFNFTVRCTDGGGNTTIEPYTVTIAPAPTALEIVTRVLPAATSGTAYSQTLVARGGVSALTWSGTPPAGLTLAADGTLSGTPSAPAVGFFIATVTDGVAVATRELRVEVKAPHRWLAYVADQLAVGRREVFVADVAAGTTGTAVRTPWPSFANAFGGDPVISPDGRKVAFRADLEVDLAFELYTVDLSGPTPGPAVKVSSPTPTPGGAFSNTMNGVFAFSWSPDSTRLLYTYRPVTVSAIQLFVVAADGGSLPQQVSQLTSTTSGVPNQAFLPLLKWGFSPDGTKVAYVANQDDNGGIFNLFELFVVDVSGPTPGPAQQASLSFPFATTNVDSFLWAGSDALVYLVDDSTLFRTELRWVDVGGSSPANDTRIDPVSPVNGGILAIFNPGIPPRPTTSPSRPVAMAPDRSRVAFIADINTPNRWELFVAELPIGGPPQPAIRLNVPFTSDFENVLSVQWSPDGNRIAYVSDEGAPNLEELHVIDLAHGAIGGAQVASAVTSTALDVNPRDASNPALAGYLWSPDSRRLAYRNTATLSRLFLVDATTPVPGAVVPDVTGTVGTNGSAVGAFGFSPDGSKLAFRLPADVNNRPDVYFVEVASPTVRHRATTVSLTGGTGVSSSWTPFWSRDSSRIYTFGHLFTTTITELGYTIVQPLPPTNPTPVKVNGTMVSGGNVSSVTLQD